MAVPRLREVAPFIELDPNELGADRLWHASSIKGAFELGRPARLSGMPRIDLILTGCVGVARDGVRLGKGGGYSDLEYGLLREHGKVDGQTPIVTTLHPSQLLRRGSLPRCAHDITIDRVFLPERAVTLPRVHARPTGILWRALSQEKIDSIPVLRIKTNNYR
jgi:5-formyltetrahydrofolate cyclo-ligase